MHARHTSDKLSTGKNHASATEDIIDEVEYNVDAMSISTVSDLNELQRGMRIWDSELSNNAQNSHQSDLEGQAAGPPHGKRNAPAVGVSGGDDTLVDPPEDIVSHVLQPCNDSLPCCLNSHPARKNRRTSQPRPNRAIGNHEHLRIVRIFRQILLLNSDSKENNSTEQHGQTDDDAVAIGLGEELDGHAERNVYWAQVVIWNSRKRRSLRRTHGRKEDEVELLYPCLSIVLQILRESRKATWRAEGSEWYHVESTKSITEAASRRDHRQSKRNV